MASKIRDILTSATLRQSSVTIIGTLVSAVIGWIFYILAARRLGPEAFGIVSVATTTSALTVSILNIGTDSGVVRFVAQYIHTEPTKALKYLKLGFITKIYGSLIALLIGVAIGPFIASTLIGKPELTVPVSIAIAGSGITLLYNFTSSSVQALQKFFTWSSMLVINNLLRLVLFLILVLVGIATVLNTIWLFLLAPLIGFVIGMLVLPKFLGTKGEQKVAKSFYVYNVWIATFSIISAVGSRLDTFLTASYLPLAEVGVYSVAVGLSGLVSQFVLALGTVISPKLAQFNSDEEAAKYVKKVQLFVLLLAVAGVIAGIPLGYVIIPMMYGAAFTASFTPFTILLIGQAIFLLSVPVHNTILYYFSQPKVFVFVTIGHIILIGVVGSLLIPLYGMVGAAMTVTLGMVYNFIVPGSWLLLKFNKRI